MNDATVFVFASGIEARPLLDTFEHTPVGGGGLELYQLDGARLLICGAGAALAAAAIDTLASRWRPRRVVLGGIARRLHDRLPVGGIAQIGAASFDRPQRITYLPVSRFGRDCLPGAHGDCTLLSRATPLADDGERLALARHADLIDREGAAVASACVQHGIECAIFKAVGEFAGARPASAGMITELNTRLAAFLLGHYRWLTEGAHAGATRRALSS
ncbi:MAG: hypothetical protein IPG43_24745 [Proteobacteria bacterium]|nr:hypothetical protein [Pseudomonadota bacterium]